MTVTRPTSTAMSPGATCPCGDPTREAFYRHVMVIECLPPAPEIALAIVAMLDRESCKASEVASLIATDQALSASLLRLANSPLIAPAKPIANVVQAITYIGFARLRDLILGLGTWKAFDGMMDSARRRALWTHAATVGSVAKMLASRAGRDGATAFTAGLLHDIGKLVLGVRLGKVYWALVTEAASSEVSMAEVEEEAFGCDHATVGRWLLELWGLPGALIDPVARHHDALFPGCSLDTPAIVALADRLVHATDLRTGRTSPEGIDAACACVPGFVDCEEWHHIYTRLADQQGAIGRLIAA